MTRPIICFLFILLLPSSILAQNGINKHGLPVHKRKKYKGLTWTTSQQVSLKYTPSSLLDIYGATLPLGVEYYFQEKFGISFDLGFPLYYVLNNYGDNPHKTINSDYRIRLDIRQYFRLREKNRMYCGAELFFRRQGIVMQESYLHYIDGNCYPYSSINATKSIYGAGILMGYSRKLSEHFILEGHVGAGLRMIRMNTDFDKSQVSPYWEGSFSTLVPGNGDRVGDKDLNIYVPFAIKIGYLF